jgi:hypothetical protein
VFGTRADESLFRSTYGKLIELELRATGASEAQSEMSKMPYAKGIE